MTASETPRRRWLGHPAIPFVLPFAVFVFFTGVQGFVPGGVLWVYPVKTAVTAAVLVAVWGSLPRLVPTRSFSSILVGLLVFAVWLIPEGRYPLMGSPETFDPFAAMEGPEVYAWIAIRLAGASIVVGVMEELFWRGFLVRWLVASDFRKVPLGTFTWLSFAITSILFALEHNRWLVGLLAGIAYNLWFYRTKSLYACVLAHAVTNLALGIYVVVTARWAFW